ncbi:MAG: fumarylacetoacetate hydrolase family protein [Myxococcales bacterium]
MTEYRVALAKLIADLENRGEIIVGWKVAINFPEVQRKLGLKHSLVAPLTRAAMQGSSEALQFAADRRPHVEAELAVLLGKDVGAELSASELRGYVAGYAACLEVVDYALPRGDLAGMLQHSFFHVGFVMGQVHPADEFRGLPRECPSLVSSDGARSAKRDDTVPQDPLEAVSLVVRQVVAAGGQLARGQVILCGSFVEPLPLAPGASLRAQFGEALGALEVTR